MVFCEEYNFQSLSEVLNGPDWLELLAWTVLNEPDMNEIDFFSEGVQALPVYFFLVFHPAIGSCHSLTFFFFSRANMYRLY